MVVSKMGQPQSPEFLELVTFQKREAGVKFKWSSDAILTVILIVAVLLLWLFFSPWGIAG
jgi:SSS family solute:Na+ symporter